MLPWSAAQARRGVHRRSCGGRRRPSCARLLRVTQAGDKAGADRQLGGRQAEGLDRQLMRHAVELEQDATRLDSADVKFRAALAAAHAHFGRLPRHWHVREDVDPNAANAPDMARDGAARRLDLARGDAAGLGRLEAIGAEGERIAAGGEAVDAAFVRLAVFEERRLQHDRTLTLPSGARRLSFGGALVLRHRVVGKHFALEHPDLHAAGAIGRLGGAVTEIDVGTQRVQRHAAFAIPLHARDLGAAKAARAIDADAERAQAHRRLHGALHRAAEGDTALELLGDAVGDQLGLDFRLADLDDVQADLAAGHLGEIGAQLLDVGALFADDDARPGRMDGDAGLLGGALDDDARHAGLQQPLDQEIAQLQVLVQQVRIILAREPARIPGSVDAEPQADRIYLLAHYAFSLPPAFLALGFLPAPAALASAAPLSSSASLARSSGARSRTTMSRFEKYFSTGDMRPRPRAWKRPSEKARPAVASLT